MGLVGLMGSMGLVGPMGLMGHEGSTGSTRLIGVNVIGGAMGQQSSTGLRVKGSWCWELGGLAGVRGQGSPTLVMLVLYLSSRSFTSSLWSSWGHLPQHWPLTPDP